MSVLSESILESTSHPNNAPRAANAAPHPPAKAPEAGPRRGLVLIVDDDIVSARMLQRTLELSEYQVRTFGSVESLLTVLGELRPAAICLDIMLPGMTGLQALPLIKRKCPTTSVLIVSSETTVDGIVTAIREGACDYLLKPVDRDMFTAAVTSAVAKSCAETELRELEQKLATLGLSRRGKHAEHLDHLFVSIARSVRSDQHLLVRSDSSKARALVAHAIHAASSRSAAPFVELDAGDTAAASQLKGFLAGLALGPGNDPANVALLGGTLYLDRIEQLGKEEQAMLLGVLGAHLANGSEPRSKGVRVVASSARDLKDEVERGRLIPDLWRLFATELSIPAPGGHDNGASIGAASAEIQTLFANPMTLDDLERLAIEAALKRSRGNVTRAMRQLGIGRTTLYRKLKRYNLR